MLHPLDPSCLDALLEDDGPLAGRFRLERDLGVDPLGQRFAVLDQSTGRGAILRLMVAPSVPLAHQGLLAFRRTQQAHPKVSPTLASGTRGELLYIAYQRAPGKRLEGMLSPRGTLSLRDLVPILSQLLMPVAALHTRGEGVGGVALRDIVLRRHQGRALFVQLEDFGLRAARAVMQGHEASIADDVHQLGVLLATLLDAIGSTEDSQADLSSSLFALVDQCLGRAAPPLADANAIIESLIDRVPPALFRLPSDEDQEIRRRSTASLTAIPMATLAEPATDPWVRSGRHHGAWRWAAIATFLAAVVLWTPKSSSRPALHRARPALTTVTGSLRPTRNPSLAIEVASTIAVPKGLQPIEHAPTTAASPPPPKREPRRARPRPSRRPAGSKRPPSSASSSPLSERALLPPSSRPRLAETVERSASLLPPSSIDP